MGFIITVFTIVAVVLCIISVVAAVSSDNFKQLLRAEVLLPLFLSFILGLTARLAYIQGEEYEQAYTNWQRSAQLANDYKDDLNDTKLKLMEYRNDMFVVKSQVETLKVQNESNIKARMAAEEAVRKTAQELMEAQEKLEKIQKVISKGETK